jgi:hypothetical protein
MPRSRKRVEFELGGRWIAREPGRPGYYLYWRDDEAGRTRRTSLGTSDLGRAKERFAEIIEKKPQAAVVNDYVSTVLEKYFEERTDGKPSEKQTRNAGRVLLQCWGTELRVRDLTETNQRKFGAWCVEQGFRLSYAARNLGVLAAAVRHAKLVPPATVVTNDNTMRERWNFTDGSPTRRYVPTDKELGRLLSAKMPERLFRWIIIQLATGGRPQTAVDLSPDMRNRDARLVDLNPPERRQNKKYRATVREARVLRYWLDLWEKEGLGTYGGRYCGYTTLEGVKTALQALRDREGVNLPLLSSYSFRHKVTTVLRQGRVSEDQISQMLGHRRVNLRVTGGYGEWSPDYLTDAAAAIDAWFIRLQKLCSRKLLSHGKPTSLQPRGKRSA